MQALIQDNLVQSLQEDFNQVIDEIFQEHMADIQNEFFSENEKMPKIRNQSGVDLSRQNQSSNYSKQLEDEENAFITQSQYQYLMQKQNQKDYQSYQQEMHYDQYILHSPEASKGEIPQDYSEKNEYKQVDKYEEEQSSFLDQLSETPEKQDKEYFQEQQQQDYYYQQEGLEESSQQQSIDYQISKDEEIQEQENKNYRFEKKTRDIEYQD